MTIRSLDSLCQEMRYLASRYDAKQVFFADDVFLLSRGNVLGFCRRLRTRTPGDAMDGADARRMPSTRKWRQPCGSAGCRRIYFGVESGSDAMLRRIRKGIDRVAIRRGDPSAKEAGMRVKTGWVFGLPGTLEEQYESVAFMRELRPHEISIHQFIPFPGTPYYERPAEHGIRIRDPKDFASFCYGGLSDNISFDYLLAQRVGRTAASTRPPSWNRKGTSAAIAPRRTDEYVFSTPLNELSMSVFHSTE